MVAARHWRRRFMARQAKGPRVVRLSGLLFLAQLSGTDSQAIGGFWQVVKTQSRILVPSDRALVPGVKITGMLELNNEL